MVEARLGCYQPVKALQSTYSMKSTNVRSILTPPTLWSVSALP